MAKNLQLKLMRASTQYHFEQSDQNEPDFYRTSLISTAKCVALVLG